MSAHQPPLRRKRRKFLLVALAFVATGAIAFATLAHPFLAVTERVDADVLVVEGWIPSYMMPAAAKEFQDGRYTLLLTSGLRLAPDNRSAENESYAHAAAESLEAAGVPESSLVPCPAPYATWSRTAKSARAVRDKLAELGIKPEGVNVLTAGPHARETWVAYQHAFGAGVPVGIISVPKRNYPADRWWMSSQGLIWVPKDFLGWLKEVVLGSRE